jgi:hypothetical protein
MKEYLGVEVQLHAFLIAEVGGGKLSASRPVRFYPQLKSSWYPLDRRLGRLQGRSGRCGDEKSPQPLLGIELPIIQSVAQRYTTERGKN